MTRRVWWFLRDRHLTESYLSDAWLRELGRREQRISDGAEWKWGPVNRPHPDHALMNQRLAQR